MTQNTKLFPTSIPEVALVIAFHLVHHYEEAMTSSMAPFIKVSMYLYCSVMIVASVTFWLSYLTLDRSVDSEGSVLDDSTSKLIAFFQEHQLTPTKLVVGVTKGIVTIVVLVVSEHMALAIAWLFFAEALAWDTQIRVHRIMQRIASHNAVKTVD